MAGASVGDAVIFTFLQVAFDRLASRDVLDYFHRKGLDDGLLHKLNVTLLSINDVIDNDEDKHHNNQHIKEWLSLVKDVVLDAEDLLDEIHTEASKSKLLLEMEPHHQLHIITTTSSSSSVSYFDKELQKTIDNLEVLASKIDVLGLKEGGGGGVGVGMGKYVSQSLPTTSLVDEVNIYGRDEDKKLIVDLLLSHSDNWSFGNNISVISIVGTGGMGKTTLAQLVFNDERVENYEFQLTAWVWVSSNFDIFKVTRAILEAFSFRYDDIKDWNILQQMLKEKLSNKKFFLVLDNVWEENYLKWEALKAPLVYGAYGSKILVTTRSEKVASTMRCVYMHQLKQLSEEQSWSLFAKYAFCSANSISEFEEIGRKIIKKCNGLPLALKTIGNHLYTKSSYKEWNGILANRKKYLRRT